MVTEWARLVQWDQALILGPIRQELLSGIREPSVFEKMRSILRDFESEAIRFDDYEEAARYSNLCRSAGVACSAVDALLCAVAVRLKAPIFTTDADFSRYSKRLAFRLHSS